MLKELLMVALKVGELLEDISVREPVVEVEALPEDEVDEGEVVARKILEALLIPPVVEHLQVLSAILGEDLTGEVFTMGAHSVAWHSEVVLQLADELLKHLSVGVLMVVRAEQLGSPLLADVLEDGT